MPTGMNDVAAFSQRGPGLGRGNIDVKNRNRDGTPRYTTRKTPRAR